MKEANFFWGVGRRKTAVARTRVMSGSGKITINDRELDTYCYTEELVRAALAPLMTVGMRDSIDVHVNVNGGGPNGQSGAIAMGIARALQRMEEGARGIDVVVGYPLSVEGRLYNAASWLRDGHTIAVYRKCELPNYSVFDERRYFVAGAEACVVEVRGVGLGLTICED
ncbi:MAG: 30S ribosomal protein S9, partial [Verrucomicrobia bacterium 21-51-4]